MKAPARAEAGRVLRMARSASECQISDGMGDSPLGWGATDRTRQNMPHPSGSPTCLVTLSSHALQRDLMKISGTLYASCAMASDEFSMGSPHENCRGQSTLLAVRLPLDFGMEPRGKMLNLLGKRCRSSGWEDFTSYTKGSRISVGPVHSSRRRRRR